VDLSLGTRRPARPAPRGRESPAGPGGHADPISPFLRRRQDERLRRSRRRRFTVRLLPAAAALLALGVAAGSILLGRWYLLHSPRFSLKRIAFTPTDHAPLADLRRIAGRHRGRNIFRLDLAGIERELEEVRWVKSAMIKRVLPDRLFCAVEERSPKGLALLNGRVHLIDEEGTPIDLHTGAAVGGSAPILTGLDESGSSRARQVARGFDFLAWLDATHPGLAREISEIDLKHPDRIGLHMNDGGPEVRLHPDDYGANLDRWLQMRDYLATHFGDGAYVDLRFRDRIVFQPLLARRN
jgi:cell division protein FtsQ